MKWLFIFCSISLILPSCVSQKKYNALKLQRDKAIVKTEKAEKKLKALKIYNQHLQDSLNNAL